MRRRNKGLNLTNNLIPDPFKGKAINMPGMGQTVGAGEKMNTKHKTFHPIKDPNIKVRFWGPKDS